MDIREGMSYTSDADTHGLAEESIAANIGVINPYALAEAVEGRKIDWEHVVDVPARLEATLKVPYENLFDPAKGSPLYLELEFDPDAEHLKKREQLPNADVLVEGLKRGLKRAEPEIVTRAVEGASAAAEVILHAGDQWKDIGDFFEGGADLFDPVQGAVGDCYLIAALSAVAWSRPYFIGNRTRPTSSTGDFVNMIEFQWGGQAIRTEVTDRLQMWGSTNNPKYARSSDPGEIWPGVYEKAYAKWKTGDSSDTPNISSIAGGDPVRSCAELTGLKRYYYSTGMSADDIWTKVRANSMTGSTFNPMVAWTYSSGDKAPGKVNYNNANLVANHAYSIHGWDYRSGAKYIVLRNPWGRKEATLGIAGGSWVTYDRSGHYGPGFWRVVNLPDNDGLFAIEAATFKKYFAGFGLVKET